MSDFIGFNARFHAELNEEIDVLTDTLLSGSVSDFTEYKRLAAKRSAFVWVLERHKQLLTLMDQANDK